MVLAAVVAGGEAEVFAEGAGEVALAGEAGAGGDVGEVGVGLAQELLGPKQLAEEALLLGLRTTAGIDLDVFRTRYGADLLAANEALVARLVDEGRIVVGAGKAGERRLAPTLSGLAVADGLAAAFDVSLPN